MMRSTRRCGWAHALPCDPACLVLCAAAIPLVLHVLHCACLLPFMASQPRSVQTCSYSGLFRRVHLPQWPSVVQVIQDLYEECGKYGKIVRVIVPRPPNPASAMELFGSNNYGKVRWEFHCFHALHPGTCAVTNSGRPPIGKV